ncbi:MAG: methyltransferase domain-containing protein, partial [Desulfobacteraceae bacterium]
MKTLCIIPARGGSKGIPRKNLVRVAGKPLIAWSIETALASDSLDRLVVSTDDEEIAAAAKSWGAEVIHRPPELATDAASSESALLHVLDALMQRERYEAELIVFLQATSPYRWAADIDAAVNLLIQEGYDSVFSACAQHFTGRWSQDESGCALPLNFDPQSRPRRQDRPVEYLENGSIYVFKPQILRETGARMGGRIGIYPMPLERSFQIDSPEDLELFEKLMADNAPGQPLATSLQPRIPPVSMIKRIQLLALDFDGVLTDNRVWVDDEGHESVCCSRGDSWGLDRLKQAGILTVVVSTERNAVVEARCRKLHIPCISNARDKAAALSQLAASMKVDRATVAFVGNDTNDRDALRWAGIPILVGDADPTLEPLAVWVARASGGQGAIREICDIIVNARKTSAAIPYEGEGIYFIRREPEKPLEYEENYWGTVSDPDGVKRDRLQEQQKYLADIDAELNFINSLPGGRLLDVGCGPGFLLSGLGSQWDPSGVEISRLAADHAQKWGSIFQGNLEDAAYPSEHFDAVVLHHVIEHLDTPLRTLREIQRLLRPGGWLILGTPDFDSGCARLFGPRYRLLHDPTHVSLFTCESIHRLLRDEGFVIE